MAYWVRDPTDPRSDPLISKPYPVNPLHCRPLPSPDPLRLRPLPILATTKEDGEDGAIFRRTKADGAPPPSPPRLPAPSAAASRPLSVAGAASSTAPRRPRFMFYWNSKVYASMNTHLGIGNTFNCNHPVVMELILDSLRHWVTEYHVDGFRFDLASILCRGTDGTPLSAPPVVRAIAKDPVLSRCKIIAEPWDCGGLYLVGSFPNWDRWAEWNGKYRDDIRRFIKGDSGMKGSFSTRVSGSSDLYQVNRRKPFHSINFVIAHDGFSLYDLVSYNFKHNMDNGECGNDGCNDNFSWNCGHEGETDNADIKALRSRQMKNFHLALMISQGTPMMLMGDEYGHTRYGNNNSYGHDTQINHFLWHQLEERRISHFRFFSEMIKYRLKHHIFGRDRFLGKKDVTWHEDNWDNPDSKFLAFTLHDEEFGGDIYLAFNAHDYFVHAAVPSPPHQKHWHRVVDTNLKSPEDFVPNGIPFSKTVYHMAPFSSILLEAKP